MDKKECNEVFEKLKNALVNVPILRALDWNKPFHVYVNASKFAIGCVLVQHDEHNMDFPILYASRHLNSAKKAYSTIEC